jgi:hypothetical protein
VHAGEQTEAESVGADSADAGATPPAAEQDDEQQERAESGKGAKRHRSIPTWEEAIGLIVSANLEARSKKPGGGGSRGRGKGRASGKGRGGGKSRSSRDDASKKG